MRTVSHQDTLWTNHYGSWLFDYAYDVRSTDDGGFILVGISNSYSSPYYQAYLVKTNSDGDQLWHKTYGGPYSDRGYSIQIAADGGFVIAGSSEEHTSSGGLDVYLIRTDSDGDTLWTRTYGGSQNDEGEAVVITADQGCMIAGYTNSYGAGDKDFYMIRTDSSGDTLWTRTYGGAYDDLAWAVAAAPDSGFIVNGYTMSSGAGQSDYYMLKVDASGDLLWSHTYGGNNYDNGTCVRELPDGGYLIGGYTKSFGDTNGACSILDVENIAPLPCIRMFMKDIQCCDNVVFDYMDEHIVVPHVSVVGFHVVSVLFGQTVVALDAGAEFLKSLVQP